MVGFRCPKRNNEKLVFISCAHYHAGMNDHQRLTLYIGTYTRRTSTGIYRSTFDPETGTLSDAVLAAEASNPTFLATHPERPILYAVADGPGAEGGGHAYAFAIDAVTGGLAMRGVAATSAGRACHASLDSAASALFFADYGEGAAGLLPLDVNGVPSASTVQHGFTHGSQVHPERQDKAHAHSINVAPGNRYVYVPDLGGDRIYAFGFDSEGRDLVPLNPPWVETAPGAGPRHMTFHPNGVDAFVINELDSTIVTYRFDSECGALHPVSVATTLPEDFHGDSICAHIQVSPDGRYVYGSNRGHDSIVVFAYANHSGALTKVQCVPCGGAHPRHFALDPSGRYLLVANMDGDNVVVFAREALTGMLSDAGSSINVSMPVCLVWGRSAPAA